MDTVESFISLLCHASSSSQGRRLRTSLVAFAREYSDFQAQSRRRLLQLNENHRRHEAAVEHIERDMGRFQQMVDWWQSSGVPPTEACLALVTDAHRARLALVSAHKRKLEETKLECKRQARRDACAAEKFATAATLTHIDWLRAAAESLKQPWAARQLLAISIVVKSGFGSDVLPYLVDMWSRNFPTEQAVKNPLSPDACVHPPPPKRRRACAGVGA